MKNRLSSSLYSVLAILAAILVLVSCRAAPPQASSGSQPAALEAAQAITPPPKPTLAEVGRPYPPSLQTATRPALVELVQSASEATATFAATPTPRPFVLCSPLELHGLEVLREIISDGYHPPPMGKDDRHQGVDFAYYNRDGRESIAGEGVQAILGGIVAASLHDSFPFGNLVIVETPGATVPADLAESLGMGPGESLYSLYAHMQAAPLVELGQEVNACQQLGIVGRSGNAGSPHLHLETRFGPPGSVFDVMGYYLAKSTPQERENYVLWRMSGVFRHFDPMRMLQGVGE